jgi:hypothetical protein
VFLLLLSVCGKMAPVLSNGRFRALGFYLAFNGAVLACAGFLVPKLASVAAELQPVLEGAKSSELSRVDKFTMAEIAAAQAPQVPVPRTVVAYEQPEIPVQVLAVRIDDAEGVSVKPMRLKKATARLAKSGRVKKTARRYEAELLPIVVETSATGLVPGRRSRAGRMAETTRDITNRTLGVLVAMKN